MNILTKREQEVYEQLLKNSNLLNTSIDNLCKELKISYGTIYSIIDKLGFNGYKDLILNIASKNSQTESSLSEEYQELIKANFNPAIQNNIEELLEIIKGKKVVFIGKSHSNIIAKKFSFDFNRLGINSFAVDNDYDQIMLTVANLSDEYVLIAITNSGLTDWIMDALKEANKNKIPCITITCSNSHSLDKISNLVVRLSNRNRMGLRSRITNFIPLLVFLDCIWEFVIKKEHETNIQK